MEEIKYKCSKCKQTKTYNEFGECRHKKSDRKVAYWCKECRSKQDRTNEYGRQKKYKKCKICLLNKKLDKNGACKSCNLENGFKQCNKCQKLYFMFEYFFYKTKNTCKECY